MADWTNLHAIIFDFDGVIADSNDIKLSAMKKLFEKDSDKLPEIVVLYEQMGGLSRLIKFERFYRDILGRSLDINERGRLADRYRDMVIDRVIACPSIAGSSEFLARYSRRQPIFLLSGTPQAELDVVVAARGLRRYFREVHGSPPGKVDVISSVLTRYELRPHNVVMIGDAVLDQEAAQNTGIGFIGLVASGNSNPFAEQTPTVADLTSLADILSKMYAGE